MKKTARRFRRFLCYILVISMIISLIAPTGVVNATSQNGLNIKKATMIVGEKITLSLYGDTIAKAVSMNKKIATINKNGVVKAKKIGTTKVIVTGSKGKKYNCTIKVKAGLSKNELYVTKGKAASVKLMGAKARSTSSKNKKIATVKLVNGEIKVKAKKAGAVDIKVKGENKKTYTLKVTVENPSISDKNVTLAKGDSVTIKLNNTKQTATWKSSKSKVANVSNTGLVTASSAGTSKIYGYDESGKKYTCTVKVEEPTLTASKLYLSVDQNLKLTLNGNTQDVTWSTSKASIVNVDSEGNISAISRGDAYITAAVKSGAKFKCAVNVTDKEITVDDKKDSGIPEKKSESSDKDADVDSKDADPSGNPENKDNGDPVGDGDKEDTPVNEEKFFVSFISVGGGDPMEAIEVKAGTKIGELPIPGYKAGERRFVGWFYDEACTEPAKNEDEIRSTIILYVKSEEIKHETLDDAVKVTAKSDVDKDFKIVVNSKNTALTAEEVYDSLQVTNIRHSDSDSYQLKQNNICVTGENGVYTITGKHILIGKTVDGFEAGTDYRILLPSVAEGDEAELTFAGCPDSVREYDLGIAVKEQNNLALSSDVVSVPINKLEGLYDDKGNKLSYIDGSFYNIDAQGNKTESMDYSGYFIWDDEAAKDIKPGSTIAVYNGMDPAESLKDPAAFNNNKDNHIAYLSVTRVEGNKFYYGNAAIEDVIKMPKVLPVPADADIKHDDKENTLEIPESYLDWSDDAYSQMKLDSQTKLEVGDFIALYSGSLGSDNMKQAGDYVEVLDVMAGGTYIDNLGEEKPYVLITTKKATLDNIVDATQTHYSKPADIMNELTPDQVDEIEEDIKTDVYESGFVKEAGLYLAKAAVATDKFKSLDHVEDIEEYEFNVDERSIYASKLDDLKSSYEDAEEKYDSFHDKYKEYNEKYQEIMETYKQFSAGEDEDEGNVDIKLDHLDVDVSKAEKLGSGLAATIDVGFTIEVKFKAIGSDDGDKKDGEDDKKDGGDDKKEKDKDDKKENDKDDKKSDDNKPEDAEEENTINISVNAVFVQEVQYEIGLDASVEWETALGFIPYPVDVIFEPSITTGTYTDIKITSLIATAGNDDGMGSVFGDAKEMYTDITDELENLMNSDEVEEEEDAEDIANWLSFRYSEMLESEHDAIKLVNKQLFEAKYEAVPGVLSCGITGTLVVSVDAVISLGIEFENIQSKKTIYSIHVLKGKCTTNTIDVIAPELDFKFYVMGYLELKVGVEFEFYVELLEGALGKESLTVGVGVYLDLMGFFYYHLHILNGKKTTNSAGALYVELGIYLEIGLGAQVGKNYKTIKGKLVELSIPIYENKWPIKKFGEKDVPFNFELRQEKYEDVELHQYITRFNLPDEYYIVNTINLEEGTITPTVYDDDCYTVKFSNDYFGYDEEKHAIYLKDGYKGMEAECDATLEYVNGDIPLSYAKMSRTIHITWDNYLDGYAITPFSEGGSYVPVTIAKNGNPVTKPKDPERIGYVFDGWYTKDGQKYEYPSVMPAENVTIYAHWKPADNIRYTAYYYLEDKNSPGTYTCAGKKSYGGTTGETALVTPVDYDNYITPKSESVEILADGSAFVRFYYDLIRGTDIFKTGEHGSMADVKRVTMIGDDVYVPAFATSGYKFTGWKNTETGEVISADDIASGNANAAAKPGVIRTVTGDNYKTTTYEAQWEVRDDILYRVEYYVQQPSGAYTVQAIDYGQGKAGAVVEPETLRNAIVETSIIKTDALGNTTEKTVKGKADEIFVEKAGEEEMVSFDSITVGGQPVSETNPAKIAGNGSLVIKVKYKRKSCTVTLVGSGDDDTSNLYTDYDILYGAKLALPIPARSGYTFNGYADSDNVPVEVDPDTGISVVTVTGDTTYTSLGWKANTFTVKYDADGGIMSEADTQEFVNGSDGKINDAPVKTGYEFKGWKNMATGSIYEAGKTVSIKTSVIGDVITLKAQWELKGYDITYDADGGVIEAGINPDNYNEFTENKVLSSPVKAGYDFDGWYYGDEKIVLVPGDKREDLTLKAKWTAKNDTTYVVNHYTENADGKGKTLVLKENLTGTTDETVTPAVKTYEGFTSPEAVAVQITGDGKAEVDYLYKRNKHTVTLDLDGGMIAGETEKVLNFGTLIKDAFDQPQKEHFMFAGWTVEGDAATMVPDKDITLKASWLGTDLGSVTINHYQMDMSGNYSILAFSETINGDDGKEVTATVKEYEGFISPETEKVVLEGGKSKEINLRYARKQVNVNWDLAGGEASGDYTQGKTYYGTALIAPVPIKANYTYAWDKTPVATVGLEDISYKASWTPNDYKVSFDAGCGKLNDSDLYKIVTFDNEYGELPVPTIEGVEASFIGWFDKAEDGSEIKATDKVTTGKDHILYARYNFTEAPIIYEGLEATDKNTNPVKYRLGKTEDIYIVAPERDGYTFLGWTDGSGSDPVTPYVISADSTKEITLTANWKAIAYRLQLYGAAGLYLNREYKYGESLSNITLPRYTGYELKGWINVATSESLSELPETMPDSDLVLKAEWDKITYRLLVGNKDGDEEIEDISWVIDDDAMILQPPTKNRTGYNFEGWYTSSSFEEDTLMEKIIPVANNITVYAKWTAKSYTANFYFNEGTSTGSIDPYTENMVYGATKKIKTAGELGLSRAGYEFKGWALTANAGVNAVKYSDGATIGNNIDSAVFDDGMINLYAVWKPIEYTITYNSWNVGGTDDGGNPTKYTIKSSDVGLKVPTLKGDCEFVGWFDADGNKVSKLILKGQTGNKTLTAKWMSPGVFSISIDKSNGNMAGKDTDYTRFKITRTVPSGSEPLDAVQRVYYRTVNGTAIGGTASAVNFLHVGGDNYYAEFTKDSCSCKVNDQTNTGTVNQTTGISTVTFDVKNEKVSTIYNGADVNEGENSVYAQLYNLDGTAGRYYMAEIYRVDNATNSTGPKGEISSTAKSVKRTMTMPSKNILTNGDMYFTKDKTFENEERDHISSKYHKYNVNDILDSEKAKFLKAAGTEATVESRSEVISAHCSIGDYSTDEYAVLRLYLRIGNNGDGTSFGNEKVPYQLQLRGAQYVVKKGGSYGTVLENVSLDDFAIYLRFILQDIIKKQLEEKNGTNNATYTHTFTIKTIDTKKAPVAYGIAPNAISKYKAGDKVRFSVVYDELIGTASGLSVDTSMLGDNMPIKDVTYIDGVGTNVLVFEGTATKDFENTTNSDGTGGNNAALIKVTPVSGTVKDPQGN